MPAGGPHELVVKGKNEIKLTDILIGEVWVASGQSNMEWSVSNSDNPEQEIAAAKYPQIRLFHVKKVPSVTPATEIELDRDWSECSPQTIGNFSAVAYFFGRQIQQELKVPVGRSNPGVEHGEPWTPIVGFESVIPAANAEQAKAQRAIPLALAPLRIPHLYNGHGHRPAWLFEGTLVPGRTNRGNGVGYEQRMHALING